VIIGNPARTSALSPQTQSNFGRGGLGVADVGQLIVSDSESSECRVDMRTRHMPCAVFGADDVEPECTVEEF
jgi:hypothetical protein